MLFICVLLRDHPLGQSVAIPLKQRECFFSSSHLAIVPHLWVEPWNPSPCMLELLVGLVLYWLSFVWVTTVAVSLCHVTAISCPQANLHQHSSHLLTLKFFWPHLLYCFVNHGGRIDINTIVGLGFFKNLLLIRVFKCFHPPSSPLLKGRGETVVNGTWGCGPE